MLPQKAESDRSTPKERNSLIQMFEKSLLLYMYSSAIKIFSVLLPDQKKSVVFMRSSVKDFQLEPKSNLDLGFDGTCFYLI